MGTEVVLMKLSKSDHYWILTVRKRFNSIFGVLTQNKERDKKDLYTKFYSSTVFLFLDKPE